MPATSSSQQRLFGMVRAAQKGDMKAPSSKIAEMARRMRKSDVTDFAATGHDALPEHVEKRANSSAELRLAPSWGGGTYHVGTGRGLGLDLGYNYGLGVLPLPVAGLRVGGRNLGFGLNLLGGLRADNGVKPGWNSNQVRSVYKVVGDQFGSKSPEDGNTKAESRAEKKEESKTEGKLDPEKVEKQALFIEGVIQAGQEAGFDGLRLLDFVKVATAPATPQPMKPLEPMTPPAAPAPAAAPSSPAPQAGPYDFRNDPAVTAMAQRQREVLAKKRKELERMQQPGAGAQPQQGQDAQKPAGQEKTAYLHPAAGVGIGAGLGAAVHGTIGAGVGAAFGGLRGLDPGETRKKSIWKGVRTGAGIGALLGLARGGLAGGFAASDMNRRESAPLMREL
jgi:hypothetical protein